MVNGVTAHVGGAFPVMSSRAARFEFSRSDPDSRLLLSGLRRWALVDLPRLNCDILAGREEPAALVAPLNSSVLTHVPPPESFSEHQTRQLLVHLGIWGTCVTRHYQEHHPPIREHPEYPLDLLRVGPDRIPFREYYTRLATWSGTVHPRREAFASLMRWNTPTAEVRWRGELLATLPGAFDDGEVVTYTGDVGERMFFELIKKCEAIEAAANGLVEPLSAGMVDPFSGEATDRIAVATAMLGTLRAIMREFTARKPYDGILTVDHFIKVVRQFGVHWEIGDIPPSGPQDPEFLKRDLLLGIDFPGFPAHVRSTLPALLHEERRTLGTLLGRRPVPVEILAAIGLDPVSLARMTPSELAATAHRYPILVAMYLLLRKNAKLSGTHLRLAKGYLYKPARGRPDDNEAQLARSPIRSASLEWRNPCWID